MVVAQPRILTQEQTQQYQEDGYLILRGLLQTDEAAELRDAFMQQADRGAIPGLFEVRESEDAADPLARYPRMMHPHRHPDQPVGPLAMQYMLDRRFETVLHDLFEDEPIAAQSMFYFKPPGARGQAAHQDNFYLRVHPGSCMAAWVAVDDADEGNGGLFVVPGSHRLGVFCPERADLTVSFTNDYVPIPQGLEEVPLRLKAGDVLFFNGSVIHGSHPNASEERYRRAFICHYIPQSSLEVSQWYRPLLRFNGEEAIYNAATGGGPCGVVEEAAGPH